jgi:hypothetical protein
MSWYAWRLPEQKYDAALVERCRLADLNARRQVMPKALRRLEKLEAAAPTGAGNRVIGLSGRIVWDSWDPSAISDDDAAATLSSLLDRMELTAERLRSQPDYESPTDAQRADARCGLDEVVERYRAEWAAVEPGAAACPQTTRTHRVGRFDRRLVCWFS